jgi:hypothetical protein
VLVENLHAADARARDADFAGDRTNDITRAHAIQSADGHEESLPSLAAFRGCGWTGCLRYRGTRCFLKRITLCTSTLQQSECGCRDFHGIELL